VGHPNYFVSECVFGISEGFRSHWVSREVNLVDRQVTQNKSLALVTMSVTTFRVRVRIPLLGSLTSLRYRLLLKSALNQVLGLVARLGAVDRSRGIFRSTVSRILLRNFDLLLYLLRQRHALGVLFLILFG
jgi:hypothetical protein